MRKLDLVRAAFFDLGLCLLIPLFFASEASTTRNGEELRTNHSLEERPQGNRRVQGVPQKLVARGLLRFVSQFCRQLISASTFTLYAVAPTAGAQSSEGCRDSENENLLDWHSHVHVSFSVFGLNSCANPYADTLGRYMETVDEFDPKVDFPRHMEMSPRCVEWGKVK